jgi:hypothetical protein
MMPRLCTQWASCQVHLIHTNISVSALVQQSQAALAHVYFDHHHYHHCQRLGSVGCQCKLMLCSEGVQELVECLEVNNHCPMFLTTALLPEAAMEHALNTVQTDNRIRWWTPDATSQWELLYECTKGQVDWNSPNGKLLPLGVCCALPLCPASWSCPDLPCHALLCSAVCRPALLCCVLPCPAAPCAAVMHALCF